MSQNILAPHYPQRRTFRGRGGPTDRRLPKQNAARRRPQLHPTTRPDPCGPAQTPTDTDSADADTETETVLLVATLAGQNPIAAEENVDISVSASNAAVCQQYQELENEEPETGQGVRGEPDLLTTSDSVDRKPESSLLANELNHLHKRIRNNCSAMSLSATALGNPVSYQTNVLAACQNTVKEWRSIYVRYYHDDDCRTISTMTETTDVWRTTGQAIFDLVQQSLQCGPLAGSQPAYFKRCGADTAKLVHSYLEAILTILLLTDKDKPVPDSETGTNNSQHDTIRLLGFTGKQSAAIVKWKRNAQLAAERAGDLPSRSVLRNQDKAAAAKSRKANSKKKKWTN